MDKRQVHCKCCSGTHWGPFNSARPTGNIGIHALAGHQGAFLFNSIHKGFVNWYFKVLIESPASQPPLLSFIDTEEDVIHFIYNNCCIPVPGPTPKCKACSVSDGGKM